MTDLRLVHGGNPSPAPESSASVAQTAVIPRDPKSASSTSPYGSADAEALEPGNTLGNYLIISKLGEGGMGVVYKAHDTTLDRTVAIKILSPHLFRNQEFLQRFRIEAQAQARLNGPSIVTLHSLFETNGSLALVMEYVEGSTLAQRIQNEGHLSVATTVWVFEQALVGVERAHRMGIVHRDLKPSNIFITTTHEIKLMDFGVAKFTNTQEVTQSGSMIGTLMYISPEQIKGKDADFRSDIYTLGITLFEAVTGRLPFEKKTDYEFMDAHLHEEPPRPSTLRPEIPQELENVILKAIDKDPDKRFQSAHEFRSALIKVGMIHVRAYRRLKSIRNDRERAIKAHYRQAEAAAAGGVSLDVGSASTTASFPTLPSWLQGVLPVARRYAMITLGGIVPLAVAAIALGHYLTDSQDAPQRVATVDSAAHPAVEPAVSILPVAPVMLGPMPTVEEKPVLAKSAAPPAAPSPAVAKTESASQRARSTSSVSNVSPGSPRANRSAESDRAPIEAAVPADDKYKALRKAWGG